MNYDDILRQQEQKEASIEVPLLTEEELRKWHLNESIKIDKEKRQLTYRQIQHKKALAEEGKTDKIVELTGTVVRSIMTNEMTRETAVDVAYSELSKEDAAFFSKEKHKEIYGLHKKVTSSTELDVMLKESEAIDLRKISKKRKPNDYINGILSPKTSADIDARLKETEKAVAFLLLAHEKHLQNQRLNEQKFEQIGTVLLAYEQRFKALATLGVEPKKIELYKLRLEHPKFTQQQLADSIGKSRLTVIRWLKDISNTYSEVDT